MSDWKKGYITWTKGRTLFASIVFTWDLPKFENKIIQRSFDWDRVIVGGPAVKLIPNYFKNYSFVKVLSDYPGALQMYNPDATRTSIGCIRKCNFCAIPKTEGRLQELNKWPDKRIIVDNNILATSKDHFDRVINKLKKHQTCDFNQGLDARLLTRYHSDRLTELQKPIIRLAFDSMKNINQFENALELLFKSGIPKRNIRSYALIGYDSGVDEAWARCRIIESYGFKVAPMWYHELNAFKKNIVTKKQSELGWSDYERRKIMQWYYKHKKAVRY